MVGPAALSRLLVGLAVVPVVMIIALAAVVQLLKALLAGQPATEIEVVTRRLVPTKMEAEEVAQVVLVARRAQAV